MPILVGPQSPTELPEEPPVEVAPVLDSPSMFWTGWTGDEWQLAGNFAALTLLERDRTGMIMPPVEHILTESATGDGAHWQGYKTRVRELQWPLFVWGDDGTAMRAEHDRFLRTLQPDQTGVFTVAFPDGLRKSLNLRYSSGAEGSQGANVYGVTWMRHVLSLIATDPYFYGTAQTITFGNASATNFYGGGTVGVSKAPPFVISSSQTLANATVFNSGDRPAWPVWKIHGPFTSFTVGVGSATITLTVTKTAGQWVEINTDPLQGTLKDQAGANMWASAGTVTFAALPPLATTPLSITIGGSDANTKVDFTFTPRWWRAW